MSSGKITDIAKIINEVKAWNATIPESVRTCLNESADVYSAQEAYGILGMGSDEIKNKV